MESRVCNALKIALPPHNAASDHPAMPPATTPKATPRRPRHAAPSAHRQPLNEDADNAMQDVVAPANSRQSAAPNTHRQPLNPEAGSDLQSAVTPAHNRQNATQSAHHQPLNPEAGNTVQSTVAPAHSRQNAAPNTHHQPLKTEAGNALQSAVAPAPRAFSLDRRRRAHTACPKPPRIPQRRTHNHNNDDLTYDLLNANEPIHSRSCAMPGTPMPVSHRPVHTPGATAAPATEPTQRAHAQRHLPPPTSAPAQRVERALAPLPAAPPRPNTAPAPAWPAQTQPAGSRHASAAAPAHSIALAQNNTRGDV